MLDQQGDVAGQGERGWQGSAADGRAGEPLYTREMPGGGYVRVELLANDRAAAGSRRRRGRVIIEPRAPGRASETPLVVEELEGEDENALVGELFRIAHDNVALARRVLRRRSALQPVVRRAD